MKISRDLLFEQIRAHAAEIIDGWIRQQGQSFPEEIDLAAGEHIHMELCFKPVRVRITTDPAHISCDGIDCTATLEFAAGVTGAFVAATLTRKGWYGDPKAVFCPRCKPVEKQAN